MLRYQQTMGRVKHLVIIYRYYAYKLIMFIINYS